MSPRDAGRYGRSFADVYDAWYADLDDPMLVASAITERCRPGSTVVELGAGTGRLARPIADAGFTVIALDVSLAMLRQVEPVLLPIVADAGQSPIRAAAAAAVIVGYNTFLGLGDRREQTACLAEAARVLDDGGWLAIEAVVTTVPVGDVPIHDVSVVEHPTDPDALVAVLTELGRDGAGHPVVTGAHVELGPDRITTRPWHIAGVATDELDSMATAAGLEPSGRYADWAHTPYGPDDSRHVSWYRRVASDRS